MPSAERSAWILTHTHLDHLVAAHGYLTPVGQAEVGRARKANVLGGMRARAKRVRCPPGVARGG